MPNQFGVIVGATLGSLVTYELLVGRKLRRNFRRLAYLYTEQAQAATVLDEQLGYLVHVLNENEVQLDEFDLIALPSIVRK